MADRIKGITVEIGGDTSGLDKALKKTNSEINGTQKELKQVERLLKLDPTNTDLLAQRQELLSKAVGQTTDKLDVLKKAKAQADEQMKNGTEVNQAEYRRLEREIVQTEQNLGSLQKAANESNAALAAIGATADKISNGAGKIASATKGISAAAGGALTALGGAAYKAVTMSDDLNTLAKQSGFTTAELQKMQYAADRIDVSVETITGSATKLKKNMTSTSKDVTAAFDQLGVSVRDGNGGLRSSTDVFNEVVVGLSKIENETERDTLAMTLFGKSADQLAGVIDDGGAALAAYGEEAENLGLILNQDTLDGLNEVNDALDQIKAQGAATLATTGAKAMEALLPIFEEVIDAIGRALEWAGSLDEDTLKLIMTVLAVVAAISPVAGIISKIMAVVSAATPIISTIITTVGAIPLAIAAAVAAIAIFGDDIQRILQKVDEFLQNIFVRDWTKQFGVLGNVLNGFFTAVKSIWDAIKLVFDGIIDFIRGVFTGDWKRAWNGVKEIFGGAFQGLVALAKAPLNLIIGLINGVIDGLNKMISGLNKISIDIPDWVPVFGGESFGLHLPEIGKIPLLANGGVVSNGGRAIVGEAGAEMLTVQGGRAYVQPLSGAGAPQIVMNNTFNGYNSAAGASVARDLAAQVNRALGRAY